MSEPVTFRQGLVLRLLVDAREPLVTEAIARSVRLPPGALAVTLRSLQRRGLLRAVRRGPGRPAAWTLTASAATIVDARSPMTS